jgi:hypothetical protein
MKFLSDILAKAGLTVDGVVTLNNTATGQTPDANDNSTKLATTAWVRTFVQPYSLPIASASILGGVKVGSGLSIDSGTGVLSVTGGGAASIKSTQTFIATGGQTVFTVTGGYTAGLIDVFLNGVYLSPNQTTATNGTTVVLDEAAAAGDIIDVIVASPVYEGATTTTDQLPEGVVNLYYTNARARAAVSLTTTGTAGLATYDSGTGVLNIPNYGSVLTNYVPYTGATGDVNLGTYGLVSDYLQLNTSPTSVPSTAGTMAWNDADGTLDIKLKGGNVTLQVGQETLYEVRNERGTTIPNGTAVYANGVTAGSGRITVDAYIADGSIREVRFLGLATEDISNGVNGFVTHFGYVRGLDTRGTAVSSISVGDENWSVGDILYVHPTVPGKLTNVKPQHEVTVAIVINRHQSSGVLFVRPSSAGHLEDIHDISIASPSNGDILQYVSSTGLWTKAAGTTTSIAEGTNLYYTSARANSDFDTRLATKSTTNLAEGTNLYYTDARVGTYLTNNSYATQTYVNTAVSNLVDAAPGTLDTLNELAAALGDDPNFATTVAASIGTKEPIITAGTTSQYWRGDKSWQTLPIYTLSGLGGQPQLNGTGFVKVSGTTVSYDNSTYYLASNPNGYITGISFANVSAKPTTIAGYGITDSLVYTTSTYSNPSWITALAWSKITGAPAFITSYTETDTLATVTGRGSITSTSITLKSATTAASLGGFSIMGAGEFMSTGSLAGYFFENRSGGTVTSSSNWYGWYATSAIVRLFNGSTDIVSINGTSGAITAGSFIKSGGTSSQFLMGDGSVSTNPGWITGYTETDTLATVTSRGASTTTALTINADEGLKVIYNGTGGDTWIRGWGIESNRGAVYLRPTTNNTQTLLIGYNDGNQNWGTVLVGSAAFTWNGETVATRTWVGNQGYITGYTETDTLATVTARGASTASGITFTAAGGSVLLKHAVAEVDAWIFQENAANWGLYWKNAPTGHHTFGGYTTVGAELFGMSAANSSGNGVTTTNFVGATSAIAQWMISNFTGYIWSASTIYAQTSMVVGGNTVYHTGNLTNLNQLTNGPGYITSSATSLSLTGNLIVSSGNATGGGIILADDGDIVDLNDSYLSLRFSSGVRIFSANRGGSVAITLGGNGVVTATTFSGALSGNATTASSISGFNNPTTAVTANTIVYRDGSGDVAAREFVLTAATIHTDTPSSMIGIYPTTNQVVKFGSGASRNFLNVPTRTGGDASGTWAINSTGYAIQSHRYHSGRDFPAGTLIETTINYSVTYGDPFILEITGNSYGSTIPFDIQYQGYIYADTIINHGGVSNGTNISGLVAINYNGKLCFWFPSQAYWQGFNVYVYTAYGTYAANVVTNISNTGKPTTAKEVDLSGNIRQSLHSGNFTSYAASSSHTHTSFGNLSISPSSASWAEGISFTMPTTSTWGGLRWRRERGNNDGNWYVGFTALDATDDLVFGANNGGAQVDNIIRLTKAGNVSTSGSFTASGDVTAFSDARVKENIVTIDNALEKTLALRGVYYNRTDKDDKSQKVGVIAQEIQQVLPQVVQEQPDGMLGVSYGNMAGLFIEAIKEQQAQIESQKSEIEELKDLVKQLINR